MMLERVSSENRFHFSEHALDVRPLAEARFTKD
jgi:hypothetical protein